MYLVSYFCANVLNFSILILVLFGFRSFEGEWIIKDFQFSRSKDEFEHHANTHHYNKLEQNKFLHAVPQVQ